jgi:hypothetical protein
MKDSVYAADIYSDDSTLRGSINFYPTFLKRTNHVPNEIKVDLESTLPKDEHKNLKKMLRQYKLSQYKT